MEVARFDGATVGLRRALHTPGSEEPHDVVGGCDRDTCVFAWAEGGRRVFRHRSVDASTGSPLGGDAPRPISAASAQQTLAMAGSPGEGLLVTLDTRPEQSWVIAHRVGGDASVLTRLGDGDGPAAATSIGGDFGVLWQSAAGSMVFSRVAEDGTVAARGLVAETPPAAVALAPIDEAHVFAVWGAPEGVVGIRLSSWGEPIGPGPRVLVGEPVDQLELTRIADGFWLAASRSAGARSPARWAGRAGPRGAPRTPPGGAGGGPSPPAGGGRRPGRVDEPRPARAPRSPLRADGRAPRPGAAHPSRPVRDLGRPASGGS